MDNAVVGDLYAATYMGVLHGQQIRNVLHFRLKSFAGAGTPTLEDSQGALGNRLDAIWTGLRAIVSSQFTMNAILVQRIKPLPRAAGVLTTPTDPVGADTGVSVPSSVSGNIKFQTQFAGKRYRGRMYIAGIAEDRIEDSEVDAATSLIMDVAGDAIAGDSTPISYNGWDFVFTHVIYHKVDTSYTETTGASVDPVARNQRRRQVGKGA